MLLLDILLITIGLLYILFLYSDIFDIKMVVPSSAPKYISVILCFIITLLIGEDGFDKRDRLLLQIGLFITILADLCLLILDYYILGIALFCLVQIIYYNRYRGGKACRPPLIFIKFIVIFLLTLAGYFIINLTPVKVNFLFAMAFFYSVCLIISTAESINAFKNNSYPCYNKYMIIVGMALFLLSDIAIAIFNMSKEFSICMYNISASLIWGLYLPSQVLLSVSGYRFKIYRGNGNTGTH